MFFATISAWLSLSALAAAYTLPENLPDGLYSVHNDNATGQEIHQLVQLADPSAIPSAALFASLSNVNPHIHTRKSSRSNSIGAVTPRGYTPGTTWCGCGWLMDPPTCDSAVADLKAQIYADYSKYAAHGGNAVKVEPHMSYYSIRGPSVAFVCLVDDNAGFFWLKVEDVTAALGRVTSNCGVYVAGTALATGYDYGSQSLIGYMQYYGGEPFCANAASSPVMTC